MRRVSSCVEDLVGVGEEETAVAESLGSHGHGESLSSHEHGESLARKQAQSSLQGTGRVLGRGKDEGAKI